MIHYPPDVEDRMKMFHTVLSEKDRRLYAAVEACKLGHGGVSYISRVLGCDRKTIRRGQKDLQRLPRDPAAGRVRKKGGATES